MSVIGAVEDAAIPAWVKPVAILATIVAIALSIWGYGEYKEGLGDKAGSTRVQAQWTADQLKQSNEKLRLTQEFMKGQKDAQDEYNARVDRLTADRAAGDRINVGLLGAVNASVSRSGTYDPTAVADRAAAGAAARVLADVFIAANARAGILADVSDARYARGKQCEAEYDRVYEALMKASAAKDAK